MEPTNRTPAGDQYSLGCTLYYCLTGRVPFPEGSAVEKMMAHQTKEPMPIKELAPDVPDGLVAVIAKLMAKTPEGRYGGCDEVVEALEPFLGDINQIPGGVPGQNAGRAPVVAGISQSSGKMAGLGSRSGVGSGSKLPPLPPRSGERPMPAPGLGGRSNPGMPAPSGDRPMPGRTPPPAPGRSAAGVPNRSTLHLPPAEEDDAAETGAAPSRTPPQPRQGAKVPSRSSAGMPPPRPAAPPARAAKAAPKQAAQDDDVPLGWAEEEPTRNSVRRNFGPIGLVCVALILMVAVYFGATLLMKQ
jgi:serine/threonine-protein kinase